MENQEIDDLFFVEDIIAIGGMVLIFTMPSLFILCDKLAKWMGAL